MVDNDFCKLTKDKIDKTIELEKEIDRLKNMIFFLRNKFMNIGILKNSLAKQKTIEHIVNYIDENLDVK